MNYQHNMDVYKHFLHSLSALIFELLNIKKQLRHQDENIGPEKGEQKIAFDASGHFSFNGLLSLFIKLNI